MNDNEKELTERILLATSRLKLIDIELADTDDVLLDAIITSAGIFYGMGRFNEDAILGSICRSYAAGRMRGRKDNAMKRFLEMEVGEDNE